MKFITKAKVFHKRLNPIINKFTYEVFYICFNIEDLSKINSKFLSVDKFNLFSIYQKDYGLKDGSNIKDWIYGIVKDYKISNVDKIYLLTHPKILNCGFNPVSFWFCLDKDEDIVAVLAEVNNTFRECHKYLIFNEDGSPIKSDQWLEAKKDFHVSPFYMIKGHYKFRFQFSKKRVAIWIDYYDDKKTLLTSLIGNNINLSDKIILKSFFKYPFMLLKVITLIHWQALKLFIKGAKYIKKPDQKKHNLTLSEKI